MAKKRQEFTRCQKLRTFKVTHSTMNIFTGESTPGAVEWKTGTCDTPLFSDAERASGLCGSCAAGWTHPDNYPVED